MSAIDQNVSMSAAEVRENLAEVINRVAYGGERIMLTRHGKVLAAMVPVEDLEALEAHEDYLDQQAAEEAWQEYREKGATPIEEVQRRLEERIAREGGERP